MESFSVHIGSFAAVAFVLKALCIFEPTLLVLSFAVPFCWWD